MLIVFANSKGGVGKTTLAVHMAIWLHDLGYRVALLDVDKQHLSSRWVRLVEPDVTVRTANNPKQIQRELVALEAEHDFVIGDGPGGTEPVSVALLLKADLALLPIMAAPLDLWSVATTARELVEEIQKVRKQGLVLRLIINGVDNRTTISKQIKDATAAIGLPTAKAEVRRLTALTDAPTHNTVVTRKWIKGYSARKDLNRLFRELLEPSFADVTKRNTTPLKKAANE